MTAPLSSPTSTHTRTRIRPRRASITYLPACSVANREDEILARLWHCKPGTAHQRKLVINGWVADVIRIRRDRGAHEAAAGYALPIEDALARPLVSAELTGFLADQANARASLAHATYRAGQTPENARRLLRKRAVARLASLDDDRAIATRHGLTLFRGMTA